MIANFARGLTTSGLGNTGSRILYGLKDCTDKNTGSRIYRG
jgi:hypothetical protein